jgi:DNA polymerase-3 subunit delta'
MLKLTDAEIGIIQEEMRKKGEDPYHNISIPKAQQIKISSIRQVRRDISRSASEPGVRIVIVSEAQMMREEAANAFLKTLEEPSSEMLLILTSSSPELLLPTIISRCQEIRFDRLAPEEVASALIARASVSDEEAGMLAHLSDGSYSRARSLIDSDIHGERQEIVQFLRGVLRRSPIAAHEEVERLSSGVDRADLQRMLGLLQLWMRDLLILRLTGNVDAILNRDQLDDLNRFNAKFPSIDLAAIIDAIERCGHAISRNAGPSLALTVLAFDITTLCFTDNTLTTA